MTTATTTISVNDLWVLGGYLDRLIKEMSATGLYDRMDADDVLEMAITNAYRQDRPDVAKLCSEVEINFCTFGDYFQRVFRIRHKPTGVIWQDDFFWVV